MSDSILEVPTGDIDGVNDYYETSVAYTPGTLWVFRDGQLIQDTDEDGWTELGGKSFRVKRLYYPGDRIAVWYSTGAPIAGVYWKPPIGYLSTNLHPTAHQIIHLKPIGDGADEQSDARDSAPTGYSIHLRPRPTAVLHLRPTPSGVEEI